MTTVKLIIKEESEVRKMPRCIDADELMERVWRDRLDSRERIAHLIESMPTIKLERKTGSWTHMPPRNSYRFVCSECGKTAYCVTGNNGRKTKVENPKCPYKFCPNCGTDMRG